MAISTINYTNKEALNENPSVAAKNKISADDMNEIKTVVNNNANETSEIINGEQYSTTEIKTNKIWVDGKPIYRKVFSGNAPGAAQWVYINAGIQNLDVVVHGYGYFKWTSGRIMILPYSEPNYGIPIDYEYPSVRIY